MERLDRVLIKARPSVFPTLEVRHPIGNVDINPVNPSAGNLPDPLHINLAPLRRVRAHPYVLITLLDPERRAAAKYCRLPGDFALQPVRMVFRQGVRRLVPIGRNALGASDINERVIFRGMRFLGHSGKGLVGFGEIVLPGPGRGFLQTIIQAVGFVLRALDGLVVLRSRPDLIALQRVGVPQPKLRRNESRINFQGCAVMLERRVEIARHAQDLSIGVLWVRFAGKDSDIALHGGERLVELAVSGIAVSQIIQRRGIVLVDRQRALEYLLCLLVAVL